MAYRTRNSSIFRRSKAQFFILSAFVMITILFVVSQFIQPTGIFDTASAVLSDDIYTFNNIKEKSISIVKLSEDCDDLRNNLNEYREFVTSFVTQSNKRLVFDVLPATCRDENPSATLHIALISTRATEEATFSTSKLG